MQILKPTVYSPAEFKLESFNNLEADRVLKNAADMDLTIDPVDVLPEAKNFWQNEADTLVFILPTYTNPINLASFVHDCGADEFNACLAENKRGDKVYICRLWWD